MIPVWFRRHARHEHDLAVDAPSSDAARQVADATRDLEAAFRRIEPTLQRLPGIVPAPRKDTPR